MREPILMQHVDLAELRREIAAEVVEQLRPLLCRAATEATVDRAEMARLLGTSVSTVDRLTADGKIPSLMGGARRMYLPSKVYEAMQR